MLAINARAVPCLLCGLLATFLLVPAQAGAEIEPARDRWSVAGQRIFFDARLSSDGSVSCASCHQPDRAFSDGRPKAVGVHGRVGTRNTPSLTGPRSSPQFWDGRRTSAHELVLDPLLNPAEHGLRSEEDVVSLVAADHETASALHQARGDNAPIAMTDVRRALASFIDDVRQPGQSPFERYRYGGDARALSQSALRGLRLFEGRAQCANCHVIGERGAPLTDDGYHVAGIETARIAPQLAWLTKTIHAMTASELHGLITSDADVAALGRYAVTKDPRDIGAFRTPSLRNVAVTAPYMHDGSIETLDAAVEQELYYRSVSLNRLIVLTSDEKVDLVAFLESLTDDRYSRPANPTTHGKSHP